MRHSLCLFSLLVFAALLVVCASTVDASDSDFDTVDDIDPAVLAALTAVSPLELSDATLGPLTQIDPPGAMTTGDWFVLFYAPWCGHCKAIKPAWEQLAGALKGVVNVAQIDATAHPESAARFHVQAFPTLLYLHRQGRLFEYDGSDRTAPALAQWARELALRADVSNGRPIPAAPTATDRLVRGVTAWADELGRVLTHNTLVAATLMAFGMMLGIILASIAMLVLVDRAPQPDYRPIPHVKKGQ